MTTPSDHTRMHDLRKQGWTLQAIADEYGITRERVRQLLLRFPRVEVVASSGPSLTQIRRVFRGLGVLAAAIERNQHGTRARYAGHHRAFPACRCDLCRGANREHSYASIGYTPKNPKPEWRKPHGPRNRKVGQA